MDTEKEHWFAEWVYFENDEEKEDAYKYLALWKKFLLRKLKGMIQKGDDQIIIRSYSYSESMSPITYPNLPTIGIKICMEGEYPKCFGYLDPKELGEL